MKKKIINDWKFIILFASFWLLFLIIYYGVNLYYDNKSFKDGFPSYKYYNIKENISNLTYLKENLMYDQQFINLTTVSEYKGTLKSQNSKELFKYYLFSLDGSNDRIYDVDEDNTSMCMTKRHFYSSIKELFGVNKKDYYDEIQYINFIGIKNKVCFNLVALNGIDVVNFIGIKNASVNEDGEITANLYYYSVYVNESGIEEKIKNQFYDFSINNNYDEFNNIFISQYNGKVEEKIVQFSEIPNGKFFKYSLISIETIN